MNEKRAAEEASSDLKGSVIDWLGIIPSHWETGNIRRFARMRTGHTPSRQAPEYWEECEIPWFTLADVWQLRDGTRKYLGETKEKISTIGLANSAAELLPSGTVILSRTASVGFSGIMPTAMATSQDFWNWVCGPKLLPDYLLWLFRAMGDKISQLTSGSTHKTIYQGDAASLQICVPPLVVQRRIARFLDEKTARIDALIEKKRALLERLAEKRQALITRAVTKGLNPAAPLKPSGIDWLGDIPAHWEVLPLKRVLGTSTYGISASLEHSGEVAILRMGNLVDGEIDFADLRFLDEVEEGLLLAENDVVFNRTNSLDLVGKASIFRESPGFPVSLASYLVRFRFEKRYYPEYANYVMGTQVLMALGRTLALPSIGQANLNPSRYAQIEFPVPPRTDQSEIVSYLNNQSKNIRNTADQIRCSVDALTEYRAALITAAVTGQLVELR